MSQPGHGPPAPGNVPLNPTLHPHTHKHHYTYTIRFLVSHARCQHSFTWCAGDPPCGCLQSVHRPNRPHVLLTPRAVSCGLPATRTPSHIKPDALRPLIKSPLAAGPLAPRAHWRRA